MTNWEYWPTWIIYLPCFLLYPYYALKTRSSLFFTVANPGIKYSGAFLTSKNAINQKLPSALLPLTLLIDNDTSLDDCLDFIDSNSLSYPIIVKPDYGLRGIGIVLIKSDAELKSFLSDNTSCYLMQEFVEYKNEIGVFVIRNDESKLEITSIVKREFMNLKGDGVSTIEQLILANPRYAMQLEWLSAHNYIDSSKVLAAGEKLELVKIGNHSRGTIFRNGNDLNSEALSNRIKSVFESFPDFNYGRLDIKYHSLEDLLEGRNFKIMELVQNFVFA